MVWCSADTNPLSANMDSLVCKQGASLLRTWIPSSANIDPLFCQHGSSLLPTWILSSANMDPLFCEHGSDLLRTWIPSSANMDPIFYEHGSSFLQTWIPSSANMDPLFCEHGSSLLRTWILSLLRTWVFLTRQDFLVFQVHGGSLGMEVIRGRVQFWGVGEIVLLHPSFVFLLALLCSIFAIFWIDFFNSRVNGCSSHFIGGLEFMDL